MKTFIKNIKGAIKENVVSTQLKNLSRIRQSGTKLKSIVEMPFEALLGFHSLNEAYTEFVEQGKISDEKRSLFSNVLKILYAEYKISDEYLDKVPEKGSALIVANQPFGGLDSLVLGSLLMQKRPDTKLVLNKNIGSLAANFDNIIPAESFSANSKETDFINTTEYKLCCEQLNEGGLLVCFPGGNLSKIDLRSQYDTDLEWDSRIAKILNENETAAIPAFIEGQNNVLAQIAGLLRPLMKNILLKRIKNQSDEISCPIKIGAIIPFKKLSRYSSDKELTDYLRLRTYILRNFETSTENDVLNLEKKVRLKFSKLTKRYKNEKVFEPVIDPISPEIISTEIEALEDKHLLIEHGDYSVYITKAWRIPETLKEIGRLREITFRAVQEGTGSSCLLDRYDKYYLQLFLWNKTTREIVGGYRVGQTDKIVRHIGLDGLYTSTLFAYKPELFEHLNPALELGRTFISPKYQRKHATLAIVWRGIGEYVGRNPKYKMLFGPVSASSDYLSISKDLMVEFLQHNELNSELSQFVKAKNPPPKPKLSELEKETVRYGMKNIDDVSALISEVEGDGKGVPVLLKHYLKLNGSILSFNMDDEFNNCMDSLIVVDLTKGEPKIIKRYLGEEGYANLMAYNKEN